MPRISSKLLFTAIAGAVGLSMLLSACQPTPAPTEPPSPPTLPPAATPTAEPQPTEEPAPTSEPVVDLKPQLVDKLWTLVGYGDAANPTIVEKDTVVTALFSADGALNGSGGCNNYFSTFELDGDQLTVADPIGSTMMFCDKGMDQESKFLTALQSAKRIAFSPEGRLEVFYDLGSSAETKLVFVPGETSLVDTVWALQSTGASDNPTPVESGLIITAIFTSEGRMSGTSGCNNYVSGYTLKDGQIEIQQPVSTLMACEFGMEQEAAFQEALGSAETYQIVGSTLEIAYKDGGVLTFTSRNLPLENTLWTLAAMNDSPVDPGIPAATVLFDPLEEPGKGVVGGAAMCNSIRGGYEIKEDALKVEPLATTMMLCPDEVMEAEVTYLDLLENAQTYQVFGQTLIVASEKGKLVFAANRAPLEGTNWRLTAFGSVEHPQMPVEGADFTAQFVRQRGIPSGLIVGGTGCNDYNAVYAANLSEIRVNTPSRTSNPGCPAGLPEQELAYFLALDSAHSYRILGDTLQITYGEGLVLSYTAFVPEIPQPEGGPLTWLNRSRWWLVSMGNVVLRPGATITADFAINDDGVTGAVSGTSGCNTYNAQIMGYFRVGPAMSTKMFCAEPAGVMEQESAYLAMLATANSIFRSGNQLVVGSAGGLLVYYNRPVPILPVEPPVTATPVPPPTATPEAPTATPEAPAPTPVEPTPTPEAPEPPPATPEPVPPTVEPMPPIATLPSESPQAVISAPVEGQAGKTLIFDGSDSTPVGWLASYNWNFGDGTHSSGALVEHVFAAPGVYTVTLTVEDLYGQTSVKTVQIAIHY